MATDPTPAPAPEWAVNAAKDYFGRTHVAWTKAGERGYFPDLARLLASVRDAALREAAELARAEAAVASGRHGGRQVAEHVAGRIEARIGTAPKEAM